MTKVLNRAVYNLLGFTSDQMPIVNLFTAAITSQEDKQLEKLQNKIQEKIREEEEEESQKVGGSEIHDEFKNRVKKQISDTFNDEIKLYQSGYGYKGKAFRRRLF